MMKLLLVLICMVMLSNHTFAEPALTEAQKLSSLCKIWGYLKYYHPKVAKSNINWDNELIIHIKDVSAARDKHELNVVYYNWLKNLGKVRKYKKRPENPTNVKLNLDLKWIDDKDIFEDSLAGILHFVEEYRNRAKNDYITIYPLVGNTAFDNENTYPGFVYPEMGYRLLGLFRYWNIINYFYPYKYIIGTDWNDVLTDMVPKFEYAKDTVTYHLAMLELTAKINDSHAGMSTNYTERYFGIYWPAFKFKIIDNKAVVTGYFNDTLAAHDDVRIGDVILKIGGNSIKDIIIERSKYVAASNGPTLLRNLSNMILRGRYDTAQIEFDRNGQIGSKTIHRYLFKKMNYKPPVSEVCQVIGNNIGYVNMGQLKINQVDSVMAIMTTMSAIIFDVRNYPKGTLYAVVSYLDSVPTPFVKTLIPDITYPGIYHKTPPLFCGTFYKTPYRGKVVILFDETTQSHAEFTCMALQTAKNVKSIGSQTAGADGNVSKITFPGGYTTYMTGIGIFYPDGRPTQRIGIVPDIEVKPTIEGIRGGIDEVRIRAHLYIRTGK